MNQQNSKEALILEMLTTQAGLCQNDPVYRQDIEELGGHLNVNWDFCGTKAYQTFKSDECIIDVTPQTIR